MRRWLPFVLPFVLVLGVGLALFARGDTEPTSFTWRTLDALDLSVPHVRVSGMAHYPVVVEQHVPGNLFRDPQDLYLFPLFPAYDTEGRRIEVLVRTTRKPDPFVSYELMTIEGTLSRPTPDTVPFDTEILLGERSDYHFADDMLVLTPVHVEVGLDPRAR